MGRLLTDMPYVWIADGVDTRRMNQYIHAIVDLLQRPDGPDRFGVIQLCEELDQDPEMFSAVWAHLYGWQRDMIRSFRGND